MGIAGEENVHSEKASEGTWGPREESWAAWGTDTADVVLLWETAQHGNRD